MLSRPAIARCSLPAFAVVFGLGLGRRNPARKPDPIARFRSIVLPTSCRCRESCGTSREGRFPVCSSTCATPPALTMKPSLARKESSGCAMSSSGSTKLTLTKPGFKTLVDSTTGTDQARAFDFRASDAGADRACSRKQGAVRFAGNARARPLRPLQPRLIRA